MGPFVFYFHKRFTAMSAPYYNLNKRHKELLDDIFDNKVYINDPSLYYRPSNR